MRASAGPAKFDPGREGSALRSLVRERIEWGDFWGWFNFLPQRREGAKKSKKVKRERQYLNHEEHEGHEAWRAVVVRMFCQLRCPWRTLLAKRALPQRCLQARNLSPASTVAAFRLQLLWKLTKKALRLRSGQAGQGKGGKLKGKRDRIDYRCPASTIIPFNDNYFFPLVITSIS